MTRFFGAANAQGAVDPLSVSTQKRVGPRLGNTNLAATALRARPTRRRPLISQ
jgi:hypothetical protein